MENTNKSVVNNTKFNGTMNLHLCIYLSMDGTAPKMLLKKILKHFVIPCHHVNWHWANRSGFLRRTIVCLCCSSGSPLLSQPPDAIIGKLQIALFHVYIYIHTHTFNLISITSAWKHCSSSWETLYPASLPSVASNPWLHALVSPNLLSPSFSFFINPQGLQHLLKTDLQGFGWHGPQVLHPQGIEFIEGQQGDVPRQVHGGHVLLGLVMVGDGWWPLETNGTTADHLAMP